MQVVILDSASTDGTVFSALPADWKYLRIEKADFNHGDTRSQALQHVQPGTDVVVFMTQDAILATPESLNALLSAFADTAVACAYGRQLPQFDATPLAEHARYFNYPAISRTVSIADKAQLGLKTCFFSNSFAAYRLAELLEVGSFPSNVILGEDMSVAARLLMKGRRVAYVAEACVYHSHNYTFAQEFRRYFDTGVFHARAPWLLQTFGHAKGEGVRFVRSELSYLWREAPSWLPVALVANFVKWLAYKLGLIEAYLPLNLKRRCSMHKEYWG